MGRLTARTRVRRVDAAGVRTREDVLAVEEPLEIRVAGTTLTTTMRTPGDDHDLVAGFLVSEGAVTRAEHVATVRYCAGADAEGQQTYNVLDVSLRVPPPAPRLSLTTSACGVCGTAVLDDVRRRATFDVGRDEVQVPVEVLRALPTALREAQPLFAGTGGVHAAALATPAGELLCVREDVGRHNAVDKVIGWALLQDRLPLTGTVLLVSGRASFELVQKAWVAGIPVLAAVSAPSSLAVDTAREAGLTLVGFLRGDGLNVYTRTERILT